MITVDARGDVCPIPIVKTKNAIRGLTRAEEVKTLVDNEIAVENLKKMAVQKGWPVRSLRTADGTYEVVMQVPETAGSAPISASGAADTPVATTAAADAASRTSGAPAAQKCAGGDSPNIVVAVSSDRMGNGIDELGRILMKSFLFALSQQDTLPRTILFYNAGAQLTCEGSPCLEDLKKLSADDVEILTCGTCLDFQNLKDKLRVGGVTNMYEIAAKLLAADHVVKP